MVYGPVEIDQDSVCVMNYSSENDDLWAMDLDLLE